MRVVDLIRKKRDGGEHSWEEIQQIVNGYTAGTIPDYQMSAWLMAVLLRGMTPPESAALTEIMLHSGEVLDFSDLPGRKVDKHSTGGVGDKTSLVIAPMAAAAGLYVPMISGRGLGHTGGTLDKLESIAGFDVNLSLADFRKVLKKCGCGLIGQTTEIAPADKKIYALRDVTGTVESPFLICASIMSKKLAEGIDALVLDVKTGSGAFMKKEEDAANVARLMVETGKRMGKKVVALITDMNQPLGNYVGHALEVEESVRILEGAGADDLRELCLELAGWMIYLGERATSVEEGRKIAAETIRSGAAKEKLRQIISFQGGDPGVVDDPGRLPRPRNQLEFKSATSGYVAAMQAEWIGTACVVLGGGREKKEDTIDHAAGLILHKKLGDRVQAGESLCTVLYNSDARLDEAQELLRNAYQIQEKPPAGQRELVHQVIQ
ncbi:MAG TPA: thymidine phosphorylase [Terriglobales bacterium]|nr:thymidine phosphorylase [Terriglobales bacterium]